MSASPCLANLFTCARCGSCCQGETTVSLDMDDQTRMMAELGRSRQEMEESYWRVTNGVVQMRIIDHHCIFYSPQQGCTVHEGRPWRCGQWPLHPSILTDENNFHIIRASCPGLRQDLSWVEFCAIFRQLLEHQQRLLC